MNTTGHAGSENPADIAEHAPHRVAIVNHTRTLGDDPLRDALADLGLTVVSIALEDLRLDVAGTVGFDRAAFPEVDTILWRLNDSSLPATDRMRFRAQQINTMTALRACGDKLLLAAILEDHEIPTVTTAPGLPGNPVGPGFIGKPSRGAGVDRDIIYGSLWNPSDASCEAPAAGSAVIPASASEPWVIQPDVGDRFVRVLVVGGAAISASTRTPIPASPSTGKGEFGERHMVIPTTEVIELALAAAAAAGTQIAAVDIALFAPVPDSAPGAATATGSTSNGFRTPRIGQVRPAVLNVNGNPEIPAELTGAVAHALARVIREER